MKKLIGKIKAICALTVVPVRREFFISELEINRAKAVLSDNRAEGFVDTAVKILMAVVIGALVLAGLYLLFSGTILPTLTQRIQAMFNYSG